MREGDALARRSLGLTMASVQSDLDLTGDLRRLEGRRLEALVQGDFEVLEALHAPDYELINPAGDALSRSTYLGEIASGALRYSVFSPEGRIRVRRLGDAAILRYVVHIRIQRSGEMYEGRFWHTDYWERRAGDWQAVWSQATETEPVPAE